ncbi:cellulase family glycosylhydrolase [Actinoplanes sp. NPDC026619]|uniref:cellulase family glycosylhydrolase n=1 Tax=Actinoplanes sp. NPDC026619 TaxID=3155798 RepID=UPI0033C5E698
MARKKRLALAGLAIALTAGGIAAATTSAGAATAGCKVDYRIGSQWSGGFTAGVAITNLGDAVSDWRLTWAYANGQSVTQAWNATVTQSGTAVTATNASYNGNIGNGSSVSFGFNGAWTGSNAVPTSFALNGTNCTGATATTAPATTAPTAAPAADAEATVAAMQPGWNLGNSFDATGADETSWGNPKVTEALLDGVKAQGFRSVRIPVTWGQHQGAAPAYTIDAAYLTRVKEVVDQALGDGFYVMINIHHDSWQWINTMPADHDGVLARYNATWTQIATAFRDEPAQLVFESVNEPQFTDETQAPADLNELNTSFHTIVRDSGGANATRLLVLPTLNTSADQAKIDALATTIAALGDPNVAATIHYYGYWPFSVNIAGTTTFDATTQADLTGYFDRATAAFTAKGVPVILGEYGLLGFDKSTDAIEQGEKLKFFEYLGYYARLKKITTMLWDNGQHFDRTSLAWHDTELYGQIKSSWTTRSGTASTDQVFLPKTAAIASQAVTLNLNGTSFTALRQDGTDLVQGTEYTLSGDQLTLSAGLLTRLTGARPYGVNASLSVVFSAGVPWRLDIRTYDTPVVSAATGTTSAFTFPADFRGDRLATMEAKYADGTAAGPQNWTSYKEFAATFLPDYTAGTIALTSDFFAAVDDGSTVTLTLHFWSGATVTYHVAKSGTAVTGTLA